jgi:hypothetical protein
MENPSLDPTRQNRSEVSGFFPGTIRFKGVCIKPGFRTPDEKASSLAYLRGRANDLIERESIPAIVSGGLLKAIDI